MSDIHLSKFAEFADRVATFRKFAGVVPTVVNPEFIVITGDLTDGKSGLILSSLWPGNRSPLDDFSQQKTCHG